MQKKNTALQREASSKNLQKARLARTKSANNPESIKKRFWGWVSIGGPEDCWPWTGCRWKFGHGVITVRGRHKSAHRLAWEFTNGPIPEGLDCCHKCDNPPCCNPAHLFIGTASDNIRDCINKGRYNRPNGERVYCAKLKVEDVLEIRRLLSLGNGKCKLARQFGVSSSAIDAIFSGKNWKHIK